MPARLCCRSSGGPWPVQRTVAARSGGAGGWRIGCARLRRASDDQIVAVLRPALQRSRSTIYGWRNWVWRGLRDRNTFAQHGQAQVASYDAGLINVLTPRRNAAIASGLLRRQSSLLALSNHTTPSRP